MRPVSLFTRSGRASTYVLISFLSPLYSSISFIIGCFLRSGVSISSPVAYCPVFVFLGFSTRRSFSKRMMPSFLGLVSVNSSPASSYILCSWVARRSLNVRDTSFRASRSRDMPVSSISASTSMRGISMSLKRCHCPGVSSSLLRNMSQEAVTAKARSVLYAMASLTGKSRRVMSLRYGTFFPSSFIRSRTSFFSSSKFAGVWRKQSKAMVSMVCLGLSPHSRM